MTIAFLTAGLVVCTIGLTLLTYLIIQTQIEVKAMMKSTHQVQYIRTGEFEKLNEELKENLQKEFFDNLQ